jgi:hypothetical protein
MVKTLAELVSHEFPTQPPPPTQIIFAPHTNTHDGGCFLFGKRAMGALAQRPEVLAA